VEWETGSNCNGNIPICILPPSVSTSSLVFLPNRIVYSQVSIIFKWGEGLINVACPEPYMSQVPTQKKKEGGIFKKMYFSIISTVEESSGLVSS